MKLENQVVSLEYAKKLKELGVKQESLFWYEKLDLKDWEIEQGVDEYALSYQEDEPVKVTDMSAFTVAELGEMLPSHDGEGYFLTQKGLLGNVWFVTRCRMVDMQDLYRVEAKTEADARAKMLIYLLENKLI